MDKYLKRPKSEPIVQKGRFEKFNLSENPFPSSPFVNPESNDSRSNGDIYEKTIRTEEFTNITKNFLAVPQSDMNHLRLGYIMDTSYIGRGNGKSAFLVNLQKEINRDFGLTISDGLNKCFALVLSPEPSGKTKTFDSFVDLLASAIFRSNIINESLTILRLEAVISLNPKFNIKKNFPAEEDMKQKINSIDWYKSSEINFRDVTQKIMTSSYLQSLPTDFPLSQIGLFDLEPPTQKLFEGYYQNLKRGKQRMEFVFTHLVNLFLAAGISGAYIFVDDFERIPDFQSERQKRDFALELRTCLFDGLYTSAKMGFYIFLLVLHAGVPRLIQKAWEESGLEHRAPFLFKGTPRNVIRFEKITPDHVSLLIRKYLNEYRIKPTKASDLSPFNEDAISMIAETGEYNASRILKKAHEILERAADSDIKTINTAFIKSSESGGSMEERPSSGIHDAPTVDLRDKAE